jgi:hypothetical protein
MRTTRLLSTIAATALLGAGTAVAQDAKNPVMPERAPAAQQNAPAEKIAPPMKAGERGSVSTTGQGSAQTLKPGNGGSADVKAGGTIGASTQSADKPDAKTGADVKSKAGSQSGSTTLKSESDTTGQGAAGSAAKLTTEQRTKITTVIKEQKVEPAKLNISVNIGTRIPTSVRYYPLPVAVVEVYPEWRGYHYILVSNQIVIIEPDTRAVVYIIEA